MEKKETTTIHTLLILDESGSMQSIYKQALTGPMRPYSPRKRPRSSIPTRITASRS